ncbi:MAG: IS4 family transposase [Albidovulum sp.]|nr:IS4 family transposase [Albidovulum sp.]
MHRSITELESTTFFGRRFTRRQIETVRETVELLPGNSRNELAMTICEHLGWLAPNGEYRTKACLRMLERLEELGVLKLPGKVHSRSSRRRRPEITGRSDPLPEIRCDLAALGPVSLRPASGAEERAEFDELLERHHELGCPRPFGPSLRWFAVDALGRRLACLLFEAGARRLAARDDWIGWSEADRDRRLHLAISNSRFLIPPWVKVPNLASKVLSLAARRLPETWERTHGYRPALCETFVDPTRHDGACYRAANWSFVGMTEGGGKKPAKEIYAWPFELGFRDILTGRAEPSRRRTPGPSAAVEEGFTEMWREIIDDAADLAAEHDGEWMQRRRVLNSLIVMLFIFRLVVSRGEKGYGTALQELWTACRRLGVELPQDRPVAASSISKARMRLDEGIFLKLHGKILERAGDGALWNGRRVFAVDGAKMNLPRPLVERGYPTPNANARYPQGLVSCLYRLDGKIPFAFSLSANACERAAAIRHLDALGPGDVVAFDRGCFSYDMIYEMAERGLDPVFRLPSGAAKALEKFMASGEDNAIVTLEPGRDALRELRKKRPGRKFEPLRARAVRYAAGKTEFFLATTLLDDERFPLPALSDLYHGRWSIEELCKTSNGTVAVDEFHGQTERGVRQELYARFNLIALDRLFANRGEERPSRNASTT